MFILGDFEYNFLNREFILSWCSRWPYPPPCKNLKIMLIKRAIPLVSKPDGGVLLHRVCWLSCCLLGRVSPGKHMAMALGGRVSKLFGNKAYPPNSQVCQGMACCVSLGIISLAEQLPFWMTKYISRGQQKENTEASS